MKAWMNEFFGRLVVTNRVHAQLRCTSDQDIPLLDADLSVDRTPVERCSVARAQVFHDTSAVSQGEPTVKPRDAFRLGQAQITLPAPPDDDRATAKRAVDLAVSCIQSEPDHPRGPGGGHDAPQAPIIENRATRTQPPASHPGRRRWEHRCGPQ